MRLSDKMGGTQDFAGGSPRTRDVAPPRARRPHGLAILLTAMFLLRSPFLVLAQDPSATSTTINVTGRVVNALTGAAIPRALVNLNGRAVLTDPLGQFNFPAFQPVGATSVVQAYAQVTKPGYSATLDSADGQGQQLTDISSPVELKLYPDGLISGTVTGSDGEPLERVQLSVFREMGDEAARRLQQVGFTMTDSRGEYRLDEPPGRYSLLVRYSPRGGDAGQAVLPVRYPVETGDNAPGTFVLSPGDQPKIDLRAHTGIAYPVNFRVEIGSGGAQSFRISVRSSTGESFSVYAQPAGAPGEFRIELPSGSYSLHGIQQTRDRTLEAESSITVTGHATSGLTLHFVDIPSIPVQVLADTSTAGVQPTEGVQPQAPTPMNLNLHLQKTGVQEEDGAGQFRVSTLPDKSFAIMVGAGTYHLGASPGAQWYIKQATYGPLNLLTHDLTVSSGAGGESIRIVVSSAFGDVTGTMRKNGVACGGYVYLLPQEAGLVPMYTVRAGRDGSYAQRVPPGTYTVLAFDHRFRGDLHDPATQTQLTHGSATAQVAAGGQTTLDLDQQTLEKVE